MSLLLKLNALLLLTILFNSCSSRQIDADLDIPAAQYSMSPENIGRPGRIEASLRGFLSHDVELGGSTQSSILFTNSPGSVVVTTDNPTMDPGISLGAGIGVTAIEYVDIIGGKNLQGVFEIGTKICLFYQCLSDTNGFKAALYGKIGYDDDDEVSNDFLTTSTNSDEFENVSAFVRQNSRTAGVILGHRFDESSLIMLNLSYSYYKITSKIQIENGNSYDLSSRLENLNALAGYRIYSDANGKSWQSFYQVDLGYGKSKLWGTKYLNDPQMSFGLTFGIRSI